jgi:hypothetical protein
VLFVVAGVVAGNGEKDVLFVVAGVVAGNGEKDVLFVVAGNGEKLEEMFDILDICE